MGDNVNKVLLGSRWPDFDALAKTEADAMGAAYRQASPFPHLVIDNLFPADRLQEITNEFDKVSSTNWREYHGGLQRKCGTVPDAPLPPTVQDYFNLLYSGPFLRFLSQVTGINGLIPDPALYGGGMHEVNPGGSFEVHLDFVTHPRTRLTNRLAVITYLNEDWTSEDGGALELWELTPPHCGATILPTFGRTVIINQSERSLHGHPKPVREGRYRRSVIAYFYTNGLVEAGESDQLATTYIPHEGYSLRQKAELCFRLFLPTIVIKRLKSIIQSARARRPRLSA